MKLNNLQFLLAICMAALLLGGCASTSTGPDTTRGSDDADSGMMSDEKEMVSMGDLQDTFYFDYDRAVIKRDNHAELKKHAEMLKSDFSKRVRLEGHADERGTREYNLALGERRANAVRTYLVAQGASRAQIDVVSYGEEKPADRRHSEKSWAKNRRVEVVYR